MAELAFWCSVLLALYAYVGYPCALQLVSRFRSRPIRKAAITPRVSFIITAYNEERRLREKIENTLDQVYPASRLEIIVASDGSTDATDAIARGFGDRVRLVRAPERRGKEAAQQLAVMHLETDQQTERWSRPRPLRRFAIPCSRPKILYPRQGCDPKHDKGSKTEYDDDRK